MRKNDPEVIEKLASVLEDMSVLCKELLDELSQHRAIDDEEERYKQIKDKM